MMGGSGAHEYMAPCPAGRERGRARARLRRQRRGRLRRAAAGRASPPGLAAGARRHPGLTTVEQVAGSPRRPRGRPDQGPAGDRRGPGLRLVLLRGDHRLNEIKLRNTLGAGFRQASAEEIAERARTGRLHRPGRRGGAGASRTRRSRATPSSPAPTSPTPTCAACGPGRDFEFDEARRPHGRGRRHRPGRRHDRDRARDRGRQHLQARHPLLGAARRDLPRRGGHRAPDRDGQLRDRPGADHRRRDRAARRRAAASSGRGRSLPGRSTWSRSPRRGRQSARPPTASTRSCARAGVEVLYDERDAGPGEKLTDAELLGCPLRLVVGRRGLAEGIVEATERAQRRGARACRVDERGRPTRRAARGTADRRRRRPEREHAARSAAAACAASSASTAARRSPPQTRQGEPLRPLDDPQPRRLRCASRRCRSSSSSPTTPATARSARGGDALLADRGRRLPRRLPRPRHRPVQPHGGAARPAGRPPDDPRRRRRLLELRAAAALGAGRARRCASWRCWSSPSTASGTGSTSRSTGRAGSRSSRSWAAIFLALFAPRLGADGAADLGPGDGDPGHRPLRAARLRRTARPALQAEPQTP